MEVLICLIVFGSVFGFSSFAVYMKYRSKQIPGPDKKQLEEEREQRKQLEARVQNLESIVCSVDLELNARLNRLLAAQSQLGALPPAKSDGQPAANADMLRALLAGSLDDLAEMRLRVLQLPI